MYFDNTQICKIKLLHVRDFLPFELYMRSLYHIFTNNNYFLAKNCSVEIITDMSLLSEDTDYLFLHVSDVKHVCNIVPKKTKIIFIQSDYIINHHIDDFNSIYTYMNINNPANTYMFEYNPLNVKFYNNNFTNLKYHYCPLTSNMYLEEAYNRNRLSIPYHQRQIDVLYLGSNNPRRDKILNQIKAKHNLVQFQFITDINQYVYYIENSKIVVNIFSKEDNKPFDYYRLALLYSNKVLVINEKMEHIDESIDKISANMNNVMINVEYDDIPNEVDKFLTKSEQEINYITQKTYEVFKQFDMDQRVVDFFHRYKL